MPMVDVFPVEAVRVECDGGDVVVSVEVRTLRVPVFREPIWSVAVRRISAVEIRQCVDDAQARVDMTRGIFGAANRRK